MRDLVESFMEEEPSQHVSIITGVRGCGKTVFMNNACGEFRQERDWIVTELNPTRDLLTTLAATLSGEKRLKEIFNAAKIDLSALGFGIQIEGSEPIRDIEVALSKMLASLKKHHKKVLIAIDEASNTQQMRVFASSFQILLRQDLPVFLIMTGLYENIRSLQDEKNLTFLYRAPRINLGPLNMGRMTESYGRIFGLNQDQALDMARQTKGYSYAFQVLGYYTWKYRNDPTRIQAEYKQHLEEYVYEKIWQELSGEDRRVAWGVAMTPGGEVSAVRELLQMNSNSFTTYRTRLIRKGILNGDQYGVVRFELPLFDRFVIENYQME